MTDHGPRITSSRNPRALPDPGEAAGEARAAPAYRVVAGKLARHERVHKAESLPLPPQPPCNRRGIVLEKEQPALRLRARVQAALRLERYQGLQVVAHDPGQRQMGRGGYQVRQEADPLSRALDQDRLVKRHVARCRKAPDPGHGFRLPGHQRKGYRLEVRRQVARRRALVGMTGELELAALHHVGSVWEGDSDLTPSTTSRTSTILHNLPVGIPSGMIEMQVTVDHPAHVGRGVPQLRQGVLQTGAAFLPRVRDPIDVLELGVLLVAESGIDEHQPGGVLDQEAAERERDAVAVVGGDAPLPQRLRYDPEHRAAVEGLVAGLQRVTGEVPYLERGVAHLKSERGTRNAEQQGKPGLASDLLLLFRVPTSAFRVFTDHLAVGEGSYTSAPRRLGPARSPPW